jgi:hypothetical protein
VHSTQIPLSQTGLDAPQLAFVVQPVEQVWLALLQMPFAPLQSGLSLHSTQVFCFASATVSQTGVVPLHVDFAVVEHCTHEPAGTPPPFGPVVRHAGFCAS